MLSKCNAIQQFARVLTKIIVLTVTAGVIESIVLIWNAVAIAEELMQCIFNCECRNKSIVWNPWSDCISPNTCTTEGR